MARSQLTRRVVQALNGCGHSQDQKAERLNVMHCKQGCVLKDYYIISAKLDIKRV